MNRIKALLLGHLRDELSQSDRLELAAWLAESRENEALFAEINDLERVGQSLAKMDALHEDQVWDRLRAATGSAVVLPMHIPKNPKQVWIRSLTAAAVVATLLTSAYFLFIKRNPVVTSAPSAQMAKMDVQPGGNKATLTLSGGRVIVLDSAANGQLAVQGSAQVKKITNGQLVYSVSPGQKEVSAKVTLNTLSTPRGGEYQLSLPDGTQVWLNAASSITYPTAFTGKKREVSISGEAYFEVAKNSTQPFIVTVTDQQVEVLGTSFNINAYPDEPGIKTTLLDGAVRVTADASAQVVGVNTTGRKASVTLAPGQQADLVIGDNTNNTGQLTVTSAVDVETVMAWKNGRFAFTNADVQTVMRQLARWYDVTVTYEGNIPRREFNGKIGKNLTLDQVLKILTTTRVRYTIEPGRRLTIRP